MMRAAGLGLAARTAGAATSAELPAFDAANRRNAFNTFVLMEREALQRK